MRWLTPDYGLDGEVELFEDDGRSTALKFGVQVKATDEDELDSALGVRIELETVAYLKSLDVPVLIVRYHAPSESAYVRWLHSFRYHADESQQTITLRLATEDVWFEETPSRLVEDVIAIRAWRTSDPALPVRVRIAVDGHPGLTAQAAVREMRREMAELEGVLGFSASHKDQPLVATFGADFVEVAVLDMASFRWSHFAPEEIRGPVLAATVWVLAAMVLDMTGKVSLAGRVLAEYVPRTPLCAEFRVGVAIGGVLGEAGNVGGALRIAREMADSGFASASSVRAVETGLRMALPWPEWSKEQKGILAKHFDFLIGHPLLDPGHRAAVHYTYGNLLFHEGDYRGSFHEMRRAIASDSSYRARDYWLGETAAALFELDRFRCAEILYREAMSMPESELDPRARLADVLLHRGKYNEAAELLEEYLGDYETPEPWWVLKGRLLAQMKAEDALVDQVRDPERAEACVAKADGLSEPDQMLEGMLAALDADLLCHDAWHGLGALSASLGDMDRARFAFLMAIATGPACIGSFVDAFIAHLGHSDSYFVSWVFAEMGARHHGSLLFDELRGALRANGEEIPAEVGAAIDQLEAEVESTLGHEELVVRF